MSEPIYELERFPDDAWINLPLSSYSRHRRKNRMIVLGAGTFVELQKGAEALLGDEASAVFYEAGIRSGKMRPRVSSLNGKKEKWSSLND